MIQRNIKDLQSFEADSVIFTWEFKRQIHFTKFGDNSKKSPIKAEGQSETIEIEFTQFSKSLAYRWKRKPSANRNTLPHCLRMKFFVRICICSICGFITVCSIDFYKIEQQLRLQCNRYIKIFYFRTIGWRKNNSNSNNDNDNRVFLITNWKRNLICTWEIDEYTYMCVCVYKK